MLKYKTNEKLNKYYIANNGINIKYNILKIYIKRCW